MSRLLTLALLTLILLSGGYLRIGNPGVNSFGFDEAYLSLRALDMARGGQFQTIGMPSSAGVPNFPAAIWLYVPIYALSSDPLTATLFTGVVNLLAVSLFGALCYRIGGRAGMIAGTAYLALNPYAALYSRSIWAQNWLIPCGIVWLWFADGAYRPEPVTRRTMFARAACTVIAGLTLQIHYTGVVLVLVTAYLFVRGRWYKPLSSLSAVATGLGIVLLSALPMLYRVVSDPQIRAAFTNRIGSGEATIDAVSAGQALSVMIGRGWNYLNTGIHDTVSNNDVISAAALIALSLAAIGAMRLIRDQDAARTLEISAAVIVVSIAWLTRHSYTPQSHYQLLAIPCIGLLIALAMRHRNILSVAVGIIGLPILFHWTVTTAYSIALAGAIETPNGLGTPLTVVRQAAESLTADRPRLFFGHGDDPNVEGESAIFAALWYQTSYAVLNGDHLLLLPRQPVGMLGTLAAFPAWEELDSLALTAATRTIPRREGIGVQPYRAIDYPGIDRVPDLYTHLPAPVRFEDGTRLVAYRIRRIGDRIRVSTVWIYDRNAPPQTELIQQFHHLYTADSTTPIGADIPTALHKWDNSSFGDDPYFVLIADFINLPDAPYQTLQIGHYRLTSGSRIATDSGADHVAIPFQVE